MTVFGDAIAWLMDGSRWIGQGGLWDRLGEHVWFTALSLLIAILIAVPLGYVIGHTGRGREVAVAITGAARALPSFGLILLLVLLVGVVHVPFAAVTAFVLLAIPSILAGAYTGIQAIDRNTIDAARATGMTEWQILWRVEAPLGLPLLMGGIRSAALQIVATVVLAAYVNLGGLGYGIVQGLNLRRFDQMVGSAILIVVLALVLDTAFALIQRFAVPRGTRHTLTAPRGYAPVRTASTVAPIPHQKEDTP